MVSGVVIVINMFHLPSLLIFESKKVMYNFLICTSVCIAHTYVYAWNGGTYMYGTELGYTWNEIDVDQTT